MVYEWEIEDAIRDVTEEIAINPVSKFYPTFVSKATNLPVDVVNEHLLEMVKKGKLELKWEVRCERCFRNVDTIPVQNAILDEELDCLCGENVLVNRENVFPVYEINPIYREKIKEKFQVKKKRNLLHLV